MVCKRILKQIHKISTITILAAIIGIITVGPAMADKDDAPGRDRITICHYDKGDGEYKEKILSKKSANKHDVNHVNDMVPAPDEGCPEQEESEIETPSDESVDMDFIMEDLSRHHDMLAEITDSQCSIGEVVTGFGPNGEVLCSPDDTGEDNSSNIISRTETFEIASGVDLLQDYSCEAGEIMVGGIIEMPTLDDPLFNEGALYSSSEQIFSIRVFNDQSDSVTVNVTYLCSVI